MESRIKFLRAQLQWTQQELDKAEDDEYRKLVTERVDEIRSELEYCTNKVYPQSWTIKRTIIKKLS